MASSNIDLSVIIPAYNEERNVSLSYGRITDALKAVKGSYEIVFIDDGSTDGTFDEICGLRRRDPRVRLISLNGNFGKTVALDVGFKRSAGAVIVQLDADMQSDPRDIIPLLDKLKDGYDMVVGWRHDRKDPLEKRFFSRIFNTLRGIILGVRLHDANCPLRVYRRECVKNLVLYSDMHRYIPDILSMRGCKVAEAKIRHYPRIYGRSKYGLSRLFKGFTDMILLRLWQDSPPAFLRVFGVRAEDNLLKIKSES